MALFGNVSEDYTKTGKGGLTEFANKLSFVPGLRNFGTNKFGTGFLQKIPVIGGSITAVLGYVDTIIESAQWLFRGKFASAATVLAAGAVGNTVNGITDSLFWWGNAASGLGTGVSLGTHARALTENIIGGVSGALGAKPTVLAGYPAAIGSVGTAVAPQGLAASQPGFRDKIAAERGITREQADAAYRNSDAYVNYGQTEVGRA